MQATILNTTRDRNDDLNNVAKMQEDPWFFERRQSLYALHKAVQNNQVPLLDFDTSTQELIAELKMS
jgi:hypothetical protein